MQRSGIDYAKEFEVCEAENLTKTGAVQAGFDVLAVAPDGAVSCTDSLSGFSEAQIQALTGMAKSAAVGARHAWIDAGEEGRWLTHEHNGTHVFERLNRALSQQVPDPISLDELTQRSMGNVWKLSFHMCRALRESLGFDRVMMYRFHDDWSGEVIAECIADGLEPFLGLHYPPTDIPAQARRIFSEIGTRHIFSNRAPDQALFSTTGFAEGPDLTHAVSRSVSPYHLEYLRNMGTTATASCGLMIDGKLWGLLSFHHCTEMLPTLLHFEYLQQLKPGFQRILDATLTAEKDAMVVRGRRLLDRHMEHLEEENDPFQTLMLSDNALHRVTGSQGISLLIGSEVCDVGAAPEPETLRRLCQEHGADLSPEDICVLDELPEHLRAGAKDVAGCVIIRLSSAPDAYLVINRTAFNTTVFWAGDPRRAVTLDPEKRVSPRKSFERWVERMEAKALAWTPFQISTLKAAISETLNHFEVTPRELSVLLRSGMRRAVRNPRLPRESASLQVNGTGPAIALAVEQTRDEESKIIALNAQARDEFAIASVEAVGQPLRALDRCLGTDLAQQQATSFLTSIPTQTSGVRDCEVIVSLLLRYTDEDNPDYDYRILIYRFQDVTEARRIEQALLSARDRAFRDANLRDQYFAKLSHELRTPLNAMIGLSSILLHEGEVTLEERNRKRLEMIHRASEHLNEVVSLALDNAAAVQGVDATRFADQKVSDLLQGVIDLVRPMAAFRDIAVSVFIEPDLRCNVEPRAARQVLLNILSNAIKYNVPNGTVRISGYRDGPGLMRLRVNDSGVGMSQDQVARCMTPFLRFSDGEGAGLGLSIAGHLVEAMGGVMAIESVPGQGTDVDIALPLARPKVAPGPVEHSKSDAPVARH